MIPYDELETKASYKVVGHENPLVLRSKRRGGPFLFTNTLDGPMMMAISIDSEEDILSKTGGLVVLGPSWFNVSGNQEKDVEALIGMIFKSYKRVNDEEFRSKCEEIEVGGINKAYQAGMANYKTFLEFIKQAAESTVWNNDGNKLVELFVGKKFLPKFLNDLGPLTERSRKYFMEEVSEKNRKIFEIGVDEYDQAFAWEGDLWTDGMGPCITIGLTGTFNGKRFNAMLHSQDLEVRGPQLLKALHSPFGKNDIPAVHKLQDIKYFAVGGSPDSKKKAESILETFYEENLPILGVSLMTDLDSKDLSKAVHLTSGGQVYFSQYKPLKRF